ncbi:unnamed protein product [Prunus armeniaca]|uniref:TFIIB-type domain-containing protein n=1 Tax=Prunus armeniaca TaxID=36596 RepID=A0A6J5WUQ3_PRUAR|nr:unnamed protein product [Prunus armeniaca]
MENDSGFCSDCKAYTDVVLDHRSGDTICTECGLVLEERARSDPITDNGVLTVNVSNDNKKAVSCALPRLHKTLRNPDKSLHIAFESLGVMADRLALVATIRDHAKELYKKADNRKKGFSLNSKGNRDGCHGASRKEISRMKELLKKILEVDSKTTNVGDLSRRCCSRIGMANQDMKAVLETLNKSEEVDVRRSPQSALAAVMYMIAQLSNDKSTRDLTLQDT